MRHECHFSYRGKDAILHREKRRGAHWGLLIAFGWLDHAKRHGAFKVATSDRCGHVPETKKIPNAVPEFIGLRPLDADANFTSDAFSYGDCPRCGGGELQLVIVPQRLFGEVVPVDL